LLGLSLISRYSLIVIVDPALRLVDCRLGLSHLPSGRFQLRARHLRRDITGRTDTDDPNLGADEHSNERLDENLQRSPPYCWPKGWESG
jgi:hypothetical protein